MSNILCNSCQVCGENNPEPKHFWTKHKISEANYYLKYFPKKDLFTNEPLTFKSRESYIQNDFLNKVNLKNYIKSLSSEKQKDYCINLLKIRKDIKNLTYTPTQVELKSIIAPPVQFLNDLFGNYLETAQNIGFTNRFNDITSNFTPRVIPKNTKIYVDTREQKILPLNFPFEVKTLNYGDYCLSNLTFGKNYIEKKDLKDFISSFGTEHERLSREFERAEKDNGYIFVVVEEKIANALSFNHLPWIKKQTRGKMRATPDFVFRNVRDLIQRFKNIQFIFCDGKNEAARITKILLFNGDVLRFRDCELLYEQGKL